MVRRVENSIAELEARYGVTSAELQAWLQPSLCDHIPYYEIRRWVALLAVVKENDE